MIRKSKINTLPLPNSQVDERDTMFARMARLPDTLAYKDYYTSNAGLQKRDDNIRSMTPLLGSGSKYYDKEFSYQSRQIFDSIDKIQIDDSIIEQYLQLLDGKVTITNILKDIILDLGAVAVGFAKLDQEFVYSHKGRFDSEYGEDIILNHPNIIVFLVEMDYGRMQLAPQAATIYESSKQYYNAAYISKVIEKLINNLRYEAKAHYDAHYDLILPPLAVNAGLGELGRNNILIADKYGSRVRIGSISTNIKLEYDHRISLGAEKFCKVCKKCAENCPSGALSIDGEAKIRGMSKWTTNVEACYTIWRKYGTDCGICMAVCPYSHRNNYIHNSIRKIVKYFPILHKTMRLLDDLFYGKKWKGHLR